METAVIVVVALFVILGIASLIVFRRQGKVRIKGPFSTEVSVEGTNEQPSSPPGTKVERANSQAGGLTIEDTTGRGVDIKDITVYDDIRVASNVSSKDINPKP